MRQQVQLQQEERDREAIWTVQLYGGIQPRMEAAQRVTRTRTVREDNS